MIKEAALPLLWLWSPLWHGLDLGNFHKLQVWPHKGKKKKKKLKINNGENFGISMSHPLFGLYLYF